ncbi:AMP-binding protein [Nocardia crassostreae]|uniref:AMP-binding protein n=1 Tax=Nocardia crassostreae TaxID=53428 RepID=UPI00083278D1|nr:AMP-binding protein [Nocardia crassostreae]
MSTAHIDTFAADHLPPIDQWPDFLLELSELRFPDRINCAADLLDRHLAEGRGDRPCMRALGVDWTYSDVRDRVDRIAAVLVRDMGLVPGNRVLLDGPNSPMLAACWLAVIKAGGIAVTAMPLLRTKELAVMVDKARITHALCDAGLAEQLQPLRANGSPLTQVRDFGGAGAGLEADMARHDGRFDAVDTAATDVCLIAFTSGTTGIPKATAHFHRDVLAICRCFPSHIVRPEPDDVFIGSPPLAFTFGLGGLVLFPMAIGASTVLLDKAGPATLLDAITEYGATVLFTAPTAYRVLARSGPALRATPLRKCVSAGEALSASTRALWREDTGLELIDGIGATEMLHIFISADEEHARPGATGKPVPGYRARVVDESGREVGPGVVGRLAVQGPTGCRYLADDRQTVYVRDGWNYTGDAYSVDEDGYFHFHARADDMIVSAGYNIAAPEVEDAVAAHAAVADCAVVGAPDEERGQIVQAYVVLRPGYPADSELAQEIKDFVKQTVAPYKYPRSIVFVEDLPRTPTGKLQRFHLRSARDNSAAAR